MPLELPKTRIRLQPFVSISATKAGYDGTLETPDFTSANLQKIGAAQSVDVAEARTTGFWRELNKDTFGQIQEVYPNLPTYELTLSRFVLYKNFMLEEFGFSGSDIILQSRPVIIEVKWFTPEDSGLPIKVWQFFGCWFKDNKITVDVMDADLKMAQEIGATAAGVKET